METKPPCMASVTLRPPTDPSAPPGRRWVASGRAVLRSTNRGASSVDFTFYMVSSLNLCLCILLCYSCTSAHAHTCLWAQQPWSESVPTILHLPDRISNVLKKNMNMRKHWAPTWFTAGTPHLPWKTSAHFHLNYQKKNSLDSFP